MYVTYATESSADTQMRYPVPNPSVPAPPEGYRSTPWARCKVKAVLAGLRFGDGKTPSAVELEAACASEGERRGAYPTLGLVSHDLTIERVAHCVDSGGESHGHGAVSSDPSERAMG